MAYLGTKPANQVIDSALIADGTITPSDLSTGKPVWDTSGNVGIGTSSPQSPLNVSYDNNTRADCLRLTNRNTGGYGTWINFYGDYSSGYSFAKIGTENESTGATLRFHTADTSKVSQERMRIDSSGNLLVGTTSRIGFCKVGIAADGVSNNIFTIQNTSGTNSGNLAFFINSAGSAAGAIAQTGALTVSYVTTSDYRLKENVSLMTGALAKVQALKPVTYKWKVDGSDGQGFIAHELQEVVPDCVTGEKDAVDAEGNPQYQGIDTSFLVATLTAAIQEQQAIITELKTRIEALEQA